MWGTLPNASSTFAIQQGTSWRTNFEYYRTKEEWLAPGTVTMSPAWFQQAHEVTNFNWMCYGVLMKYIYISERTRWRSLPVCVKRKQ